MQLNGNKKAFRGDEAKPITNEEIDRLTVDDMTSKLRRTTTISTSPNPPATESPSDAVAAENSNQVQLASHEVPAESASPSGDADKIRRLEAMVQQLLDQKAGGSPASSLSAPRRLDAANEDGEPNEKTERLKLGRRRKAIRNEDEEPKRSATSRRSHPLEDEPADPPRPARNDELAREPSLGDPFDTPMESTSGHEDQRP